MKTVSLCVITKGEPGLVKLLKSFEHVVDWVTLTYDPADSDAVSARLLELSQIATVPCVAHRRPKVWEGNFAAAREESFVGAGDIAVWADSDDELVDPEKVFGKWLRALEGPVHVHVPYHYSHDEQGKPTFIQTRERAVVPGTGKWTPCVHEVYLPTQYVQNIQCPPGIYIKHDNKDTDLEKAGAKLIRNLKIMQGELERTKNSPDRRLVLQYALTLKSMCYFNEAMAVLADFVRTEGDAWAKSRGLTCMAECAQLQGLWQPSAEYAAASLAVVPSNLVALRLMFDAAYMQQEWSKALYWFRAAYEDTGVNKMMDTVGYRTSVLEPPFKQAAQCCVELGFWDKAVELAKKSGDTKLAEEVIQERSAKADLEAVLRMYPEVEKQGGRKARRWLSSLPKRIKEFPPVAKRLLPDVPSKSIFIHCGREGQGGGEKPTWGPESIKVGIGGSEEAVIRLVPELAKRGYHVEVYGPWDQQRLVRSGVHWIHYELFDKSRKCGTFVAWRYPELLHYAPEGAKTHLWLHDLMSGDMFKVAPLPDSVMVVSQFHKRMIQQEVPAARFHVTKNGIPDLSGYSWGNKNPHRIIFSSSMDRGIVNVLVWWPDIRKRFPDAELHIYYGFNSWWIRNEQRNPHLKEIREFVEDKVTEFADQGVTYHGNVGQEELHQAVADAGVWFYPTQWPEVFCITAIKAQALGAIPVTNDYSALAETVQFGYTIPTNQEFPDIEANEKEYLDALYAAMNGEYQVKREEMAQVINSAYSWASVAEDWDKHFEEVKNGSTVDSVGGPGLLPDSGHGAGSPGGSGGESPAAGEGGQAAGVPGAADTGTEPGSGGSSIGQGDGESVQPRGRGPGESGPDAAGDGDQGAARTSPAVEAGGA